MDTQINSGLRRMALRGLAGAVLAGSTAAAVLAVTPAGANTNLLPNPSFEQVGPAGSYVSFTGIGPGAAAAKDWEVFNNHTGTTTTDLLPTTAPGGGKQMIHVTTDSAGNGLAQQWAPTNTGPGTACFSVWVFVVRGKVGAGAGNGGNTGLDALSTTTGQWEHLQGVNPAIDSPVNEFIVYAAGQGSFDYYVDNASVTAGPCVTPLPPQVAGG